MVRCASAEMEVAPPTHASAKALAAAAHARMRTRKWFPPKTWPAHPLGNVRRIRLKAFYAARSGRRPGPAPENRRGGNGLVLPSADALFQAELAHLAIERGAADAEALGHLRHVAAVAPEREADHVGFHGLQRADLALVGDRRDAELAGARLHRLRHGVLGAQHHG